jgi:hypothetical protein
MKTMKLALLASIFFPTIAWGGQINGTLFQNGKPVANKAVQIQCGQKIVQSTATNSEGEFAVFVHQPGICQFEVVDMGLRHKIYSYQLPVRYDFDVVRAPDGRYLLRRH